MAELLAQIARAQLSAALAKSPSSSRLLLHWAHGAANGAASGGVPGDEELGGSGGGDGGSGGAVHPRTVVCTIHQPSYRIFAGFDQVVLLARGEVPSIFSHSEPLSQRLLFGSWANDLTFFFAFCPFVRPFFSSTG